MSALSAAGISDRTPNRERKWYRTRVLLWPLRSRSRESEHPGKRLYANVPAWRYRTVSSEGGHVST